MELTQQKSGERIRRKENGGEGTGVSEIRTRKKYLATGKACVVIFSNIPQALSEDLCQLWVFNRVGLNFCIRGTPLAHKI